MRGSGVLGIALQSPRIWKYRLLSDCRQITGTPILAQPVLFLGPGRIDLGRDVEFGWGRSVGFFTGYGHVEAARPAAHIEIGDAAQINNRTFIKSEGPGITIGARALIGSDVVIIDSDFHSLDPAQRRGFTSAMSPVDIGENVFVGDGVRILKGARIGADTVVGAGSVVTGALPAGVIAAGNPARVVRELDPRDADAAWKSAAGWGVGGA